MHGWPSTPNSCASSRLISGQRASTLRVAYGTSKELVHKAGLEAASRLPWTFDDQGERKPQVWLVRFGEFRLEFELIVWLTDEAVLRPQRVMADYVWEIHSALERHDIHVPHPQRDLYLKSAETLSVRIEKGAREEREKNDP